MSELQKRGYLGSGRKVHVFTHEGEYHFRILCRGFLFPRSYITFTGGVFTDEEVTCKLCQAKLGERHGPEEE